MQDFVAHIILEYALGGSRTASCCSARCIIDSMDMRAITGTGKV